MKKFLKAVKLLGISVTASFAVLAVVYFFETRTIAGGNEYQAVAVDYVATEAQTEEVTEEVTEKATEEVTEEVTEKTTEVPSVKETEAQTAAASVSEPKIYTVKAGDTIMGICKRYYGDTSKCSEVIAFNNIKDENLLYVGQQIKLP